MLALGLIPDEKGPGVPGPLGKELRPTELSLSAEGEKGTEFGSDIAPLTILPHSPENAKISCGSGLSAVFAGVERTRMAGITSCVRAQAHCKQGVRRCNSGEGGEASALASNGWRVMRLRRAVCEGKPGFYRGKARFAHHLAVCANPL